MATRRAGFREGGIVRHTTIIIAAMAIAGCAASPTPAPSKSTAPSAKARPPLTHEGVNADRAAQRTWCSYLKALYLRAEDGATEWPSFNECVEVKGTAAPALLEQTAACSLRALNAFH